MIAERPPRSKRFPVSLRTTGETGCKSARLARVVGIEEPFCGCARQQRSDLHFIAGMAPDECLALAALAYLDVNGGGGDGAVAEKALDVP